MAQTISLCMIVRDVEQPLAAALDSARGCVDEIVVVDTGSEDNTVHVAQQRGARVFHFAWCDDFSAARNRSIEHATGDWIFWMDSDDIVVPGTGEGLRRAIAESTPGGAGYLLKMQQLVDEQGLPQEHPSEWAQCKLFPRHPRIRFKYRVHEQVLHAIEEVGLPIRFCTTVVRHANLHQSPDVGTRRLERNLRLLEADLREHPDDGFVLFNFGSFFLQQAAENSRAIEYLERSLEVFPVGQSTRLEAYQRLAKAYQQAGEPRKLLATLTKALAEFPDEVNLMWRLAQAQEVLGELSQAEQSYLMALQRGRVAQFAMYTERISSRIAMDLGMLYERTGRTEQAIRFWEEHLQRQPQDLAMRRHFIHWYLRHQQVEQAERHTNLLPRGKEFQPIRSAMSGCVALLREQWEKAVRELEFSYRAGYRDPLQLHAYSVALMVTGQDAQAEPILELLLQHNPSHVNARKNLDAIRTRAGQAGHATAR